MKRLTITLSEYMGHSTKRKVNGLLLLSVCLIVLSVVCMPVFAITNEINHRPNIIIIFTDDLGTGDLSLNNSPIRTPNIDRLAREGAYLTNFYASANVCSPSRAGLLTGRYPIRMGLAYKAIEAESKTGLPQSEVTLAEFLGDLDYRTAIIGKWHLGHERKYWPTRQGFEYFYGLPYSNDMRPLALYQNEKIIEQPVKQDTLTLRYTEEASRFIKRNRTHPFFLYLAHTFPHIPLHASARFRGKSNAGIYGDAVEELDWSVGKIIKTLEAYNLDRNTLVFFTSDNGAWFEGSNSTFRDMKGLTTEGGYRVPLIAWWPGKIRAGSRSSGISMNIDIFPTIAAILNREISGVKLLDGRNIWALLNGSAVSPHKKLYLFNNEDVAAVRTQEWKYVVRGYYRQNYVAFDRFKKGFGFSYPLLFNMTEMLPERYSTAINHPDVVEEMKELLSTGRREFDPMRTKPVPKAFP